MIFPSLDFGLLINFGVAGIMLHWFMTRVEKRLDTHTKSIDKLATSILLLIVEGGPKNQNVKDEAKKVLTSLDPEIERDLNAS